MSYTVNLMNDLWYGPKKEDHVIDYLKDTLTKVSTEKDCVLLINEIMKLGDFSIKRLLVQLLNTSQEENVLNLAIRLFCSTVTHEELLDSNNFKFLSDASEESISTFSSCALDTLSYQVVPYLLVLLDEWDDTNVELVIRNSLDIMLSYSDVMDESASSEDIGEFYINFLQNIDVHQYYYFGELAYPGDLAKELVQQSVVSLRTNKILGMNMIPTLLSTWSGLRCPVEYTTLVDDDSYKKVINYVNTLSEMNWNIGKKYFYAKEVN